MTKSRTVSTIDFSYSYVMMMAEKRTEWSVIQLEQTSYEELNKLIWYVGLTVRLSA